VRRASLVYGVFLLVVVALLIASGDNAALDNGILALGGGYTIWMDVLLGVAALAARGVNERPSRVGA
jgi:hypothetical protein